MPEMKQNKDEKIRNLQEKIDALKIQLKHLENDLRLTKSEYEHSMEEYFKIYSHMEDMVEKRTEELRASQKILEQKGRELQVMLDASPALIFYKDENQRFIRVNKKFAETLGVPIQEIIGKTYQEIFPEKKQHGMESDLEVLEAEVPIYRKQEPLETTFGVRQILIDRLPYRNGSADSAGLVGFAQDVTELKQAEQENEELEAQLRQAQKMESIGILAGGIAHDFNNVMATVAGAAQLIEVFTQDEKQLKYVDMILSSVTRGKSITDRILTFARTEPPSFQSIQLRNYLKNVYDIIEHTLPSGINVSIAEPEEPMTVIGDPGHLQQVILNLCINAADAMETGGNIAIAVEKPPGKMLKKHQKTGEKKYTCITVTDSGSGIPADDLDRIFEPFYTTKEPGKGTGLGLSVAYKILQQHQGFIDIQSTVGKGTTVYLGLPLTRDSVTAGEAVDSNETFKGNGEHILLVDDEEALRNLIAERLKIHGFRVTAAQNGEEAFSIYKENPDAFELVLTDIKMPVLDGIGLFKKIHEHDSKVKVLAITGIVDQNKIKQSEGVQFDDILRKPVSIDELIASIQRALAIDEN